MQTITSLHDTWLKKNTQQAELLPENERVFVLNGHIYQFESILQLLGVHTKVKLSHEAGNWWIYQPHWTITQDEITADFTLSQAKTSRLIYGELIFSNGLKVEATSGQAGYQYHGAHNIRGRGLLPPGKWKICTNGYYCCTPGINGMFYHLTPDPHRPTGRSEFGLHRDANVSFSPGSAGCIVVSTDDLNNRITPLMESLKDTQRSILLTVQYT